MYWIVLEEAVDQKVWCDKELTDDTRKRNKKTTAAEKYEAPIEDLTRQIDSMAKKIGTLTIEQEELISAMWEA